MIFRINKNTDFTVVCNHAFRNSDLSYKAKGVLLQMLSMPDQWKFSAEMLMELATDGRDSIRSALKELEEQHYLKRTRATNDKGQFVGYDYDVYEYPTTENPNMGKPVDGKSDDGKGGVLLNTILSNTIDDTNVSLLEHKCSNEVLCSTRETNSYGWVIDYWNDKAVPSGYPRLSRIMGNREKLLRARLKEFSKEQFMMAIDNACESDFLRGQNNTGFTLTFDWLIKPTNFPKVLEGNYANNKSNQYARDNRSSNEPVAAPRKRDYNFSF